MTSRTSPPLRRHGAPRAPFPTRGGLAILCGDLDRILTTTLRPVTLPALRVLLGVLFVWFGALKVLGLSPVGELVSGTLPWADPRVTVLALGAAEVAFGAALATGVALRLVLPLLVAHLSGTFLTFVMLPQLMFHGHNPLLLTEYGEFVTKNLVLIAATLVLIAHTGPAPTPITGLATEPVTGGSTQGD
jgi:putative oxidoreductase